MGFQLLLYGLAVGGQILGPIPALDVAAMQLQAVFVAFAIQVV